MANQKILLTILPLLWPKMPSLGLAYLQSFLANKGIVADTLDLNNVYYNLAGEKLKKSWLISCNKYLEENIISIIKTNFPAAFKASINQILQYDIVGFSCFKSNFKNTLKIIKILKTKKMNMKIISITGRRDSTLAIYSDIVLDIGQIEEACPLGLAPSCSTSAMLALGDALALTIFKMRSWTKEDYAFYHPGGELGRKLIKVSEAMRVGRCNPVASQNVAIREALDVMSTEGSPGMVSLVDEEGRLVGVFTDGDLRRLLQKADSSVLDRPIKEVMTSSPRTVSADDLAAQAYRIMRDCRIDNLPVVDAQGVPVGIIDVQDWLDVERGIESPARGEP